jgi:hypothetical protein
MPSVRRTAMTAPWGSGTHGDRASVRRRDRLRARRIDLSDG